MKIDLQENIFTGVFFVLLMLVKISLSVVFFFKTEPFRNSSHFFFGRGDIFSMDAESILDCVHAKKCGLTAECQSNSADFYSD